MLKHPEIRKIILSNWPNAKINLIKEFTEGYNNLAYDVRLNIGNFVVKIIKLKGYEKYLLKQKKIRNLVRKRFKDFPIAKIIKSDYSKKIIDNYYIISERVDGKSLQSTYNKVTNKEQLYEEIGELYGKLHSFKLRNYGELDSSLKIIKPYKSWYLSKVNEIKKTLEEVKENSLLSKKAILKSEYYLEENKYLLKKEIGPCLCHGDASDSNIIVKKYGRKYHVSGLIDFEFSRSSGALYELFSGLRSFDKKYSNKDSLFRGYIKWSQLPKDWEKLIFFYQWMNHLKQLTKINGMKWRNLSEKETIERKEDLMKKSLLEINRIIN